MKRYKRILNAGLGLAMAVCSLSVSAQTTETTMPLLATPHSQSVDYVERTLMLNVRTNKDYSVTSDADWVSARKGTDGTLFVHVDRNDQMAPRAATITFKTTDGALTRNLSINQAEDGSATTLVTEKTFTPSSATANNSQSGAGIALTYDGDLSTIYHSSYSGGSTFVPTDSNPIVLTYNFRNVEQIDYITYYPRSSGDNGNFGRIGIFVKSDGNSVSDQLLEVDCGYSSSPRKITFAEPLKNPTQIVIKVYSGKNDFASCAEMEFGKNLTVPGTNVFKDDLMTELVDGFTQADLDTLSNPFIQSLASQLYKGDYDKNYRVASYVCHLNPTTLSEQLAAPGKLYDQISGVTGINFAANTKQVVIVSGIPDDMSASLKVVAWYTGKVGSNFDGGNPNTSTFALHNGINVIDYNYGYDGLAYVCYYSTDDPAKHPDIKVHFAKGQINGYLSQDKTNEEMHELLKNAPSQFMDLVGKRVHAIWTSKGLTGSDGTVYSKGLYDYCKASDGTSLGYIQYMNLLDTLVTWEHRLLGLEKYNRVPDNRTMAYVNFTYYMFQGSFGVSFHVNQESRVLNCKTLMYNDDDAIWGLSHEWGHQHQMSPYFCWGGQGEVTNNMHSCYNCLHMGYQNARIQNAWTGVYNHFFKNNRSDITTSSFRQKAYDKLSSFSWCTAIQNELKEQYAELGNTIPSYEDDPARGLSIYEVGGEEQLAPFYMLYNYFSNPDNADYVKDFQQDIYEALRQNDYDNGSSIEPDWNNGVKSAKTEVDKYELLASAQNSKSGAYDKFIAKYPNSVWTTNKYITASSNKYQNTVPFALNYIRKASKLCGYNLFEYFDRYGYLRATFGYLNDYGDYYYAMTSSMREEFKADMDALGLTVPDATMLETIAHSALPKFTTPTIPNEPIAAEKK